MGTACGGAGGTSRVGVCAEEEEGELRLKQSKAKAPELLGSAHSQLFWFLPKARFVVLLSLAVQSDFRAALAEYF